MSTLPPSPIKKFPEDSLESQVYGIVEKYAANIPIANDRVRLSFSLYKYMTGEGDEPSVSVRAAKIKLAGITHDELAARLAEDLKKIQKI